MNDPILDEIHRGRREHAEKFNFDLKALLDDLRRRERDSQEPHRIVPLKLRRTLSGASGELPATAP